MSGLLCYCRQGFEPELAAELSARAAFVGIAGYARTQRNDGYVLFVCDEAAQLAARLQWRELIFARQKLVVLAELKGLDPKDRITPILAALEGQPRFGDLWVEHPDSDAGKPLAGLARSFGNALRPALRKAGLLTDKPQARLPRLHICFLDGDHALLAVADSSDSAPWPLGIPRLKLLPEAPSRSALKLDEALLTLLTPEEREQLVKPGMRAADLGAAPGGWTWVLTRQHVHVTSVDNGRCASTCWPPAWSNICAPMAFTGSPRNRWTGWSATWSSSHAAWPNAWPPGCAKAGAATPSSISSCR